MNHHDRQFNPPQRWPSLDKFLAIAGAGVIIAALTTAWVQAGHEASRLGGYGEGLRDGHDIAVAKCVRDLGACKPMEAR